MTILRKRYADLTSEAINPRTWDIDQESTLGMLRLINQEDESVPRAVATQLPQIARAVELLYGALSQGGRMIYVGAGTSGRLGVLDASECPPTYGISPEKVQAFIAGGDTALRTAVEGAEDDEEAGRALMDERGVDGRTVVVGLTASGEAPYVIGAVTRARELGAKTVGVVTNQNTRLGGLVDVSIEPVVGPEVIMGSTRMKSGTAQKLVLNMLTTALMVRLGKVYHNMMVDLNASNQKLQDRSVRMIRQLAGAGEEQAVRALREAGGQLKTAVIILRTGVTPRQGREALAVHGGRLREALRSLGDEQP